MTPPAPADQAAPTNALPHGDLLHEITAENETSCVAIVPLVRLLEAMSLSDWIHLSKMFSEIDEARKGGRQITKKKTLSRRLGMSGPTFSKFEDRVRNGLASLLPSEEELLDEDLLPTKQGRLAWRMSAWVAQMIQQTGFDFGA